MSSTKIASTSGSEPRWGLWLGPWGGRAPVERSVDITPMIRSTRICMTVTAATRRSSRESERSMPRSSSSTSEVSNTAAAQAWTSSSLLPNARNTVPSAMPAASAT